MVNESPTSRRTVGAFGILTWDEILTIDEYPVPGDYHVLSGSYQQPGGTTGNMATALVRLGVEVSIAANVGADDVGQRLIDGLQNEGCDVRYVRPLRDVPTDRALILVSGSPPDIERTILWQQGARLRHGDHLPIDEFFQRDLVILDVDDPRLRLLIVDLPMHVSPRTRILGTLTFLRQLPQPTALELALRHDYLSGNEAEFLHITGQQTFESAVTIFQDEMILSQVRYAAISRGTRGCVLIDRERTIEIPAFEVDVVDPTGAGDAFAAGVAYGVMQRWDLSHLGRFANAMGALATRSLGARAGLPSYADVNEFIETTPVRGDHGTESRARD